LETTDTVGVAQDEIAPGQRESQSAADTLDELHARALPSNLQGPYAHADGHISDPHEANL
jgi:hypothetical protein